MEEKKKEKELPKFSQDVANSSCRVLSADTKESTELGTGSRCQSSFSDLHTVEDPVIIIKNDLPIKEVSLDMSKSSIISTSPDKKTLGTLTVLYTNPSKPQVSATRTNVLTAESDDSIYTDNVSASSAKREQVSQNAYQTDIVLVSSKPEKVEQNHGDGSVGESDAKRALSSKSRINVEPMESTGLTYTSKGLTLPSIAASKTSWNSSHVMEAICESSKNNNNNIDKPSDTSVNIAHPSVDLKEGHTLPKSEKIWCQVPYSETGKLYAHSLPCEAAALCNESVTRSSKPLSIDIFKSGGLLPRSDHGTGQCETSTGVQSSPTVNLTVNEPKLSLAFQCTSGSTSANRSITSSTSNFSREPEASTSHIEPVTSVKGRATASSILGYNVEELSRVLKMAVPLNQSSVSVSHNEAIALSGSTETGTKMAVDQSKSFVPYSVLRYSEDASDHMANVSMTPVESKKSSFHPNSPGHSKDSLSSVNLTNTSNSEAKRPSFSANNPKTEHNSLTSAAQLSVTSNQSVVTHNQPFYNNDNKVPSSVSSSKIRDSASKAIKKSHSKNNKPKAQKPPLLAADDDDDDNDFIPVGMLQLSSIKSPEDGGTVGANAEMHSAENSNGTQYQFNLGLNVMYEQQARIGSDHLTRSAEKLNFEGGNEFVQEKLKQKLQQRKLKSPAGMGQQQSTQPQKGTDLQVLAKSVKIEQEVQQGESHQQHQLLLQLVQHAQQQQRQLQDQQQHLQQPQSSLNLAKTATYSKNQGLIIHHHQQQDVKVVSNSQSLSRQNLVKDYPIESEQGGARPVKQEKKLEENIQQPSQLNKTQKKNGEFEESHKQQQKDQRYPLHHSQARQPALSGQLQPETVMHQETEWQVQSHNTPKIAERLLQQSMNDQMLQQTRSEQIHLRCKAEQLIQPSPQQVSISRVDLATSRPTTPTHASLHNTVPSVNQQHPEIARMLNSPVSPRQPGSPRQSISPRRVVSPIQSLTTSSQFISPRQTITLPARQPSGVRQSLSSKPIVNLSPSSSYQPSNLKQVDSSQHLPNSWQSLSPAHSSTSPALVESAGSSQPLTGQIISVQLLKDQTQFEQTKVDLNQSTSAQFEKPQFSDSGQQQYGSKVKQISIDGQHSAPDFSISLSNSNAQLTCSQSFSLSNSVQSFSPGQVIHHRPPERRNVQKKVLNVLKTQLPVTVQFPTQPVPSTKVPIPSFQNPNIIQCAVPGQVKSQEDSVEPPKSVDFPSSQPAGIKILSRNSEQVSESLGQKQLLEGNLVGIQHNLSSRRLIRSNSPENQSDIFQHQSREAVVDMQPYSSATNFVQPVSTHTEQRSINSLVMASSYGRPFQNIASLTEKENSFLQSLFDNNPSVQSDDRIQGSMNHTSHAVSQMQTSVEIPKKCEDSSRMYTNMASLYPEMRKNEGGLKVLSEIASERYALAVAGKDDDQQADQPGYHDIAQSTLDRSERNDQSKQMPECETVSAWIKPSHAENYTASQNQIGYSPAKTDMLIENKSSESNIEINLIEKDGNSSFTAHSETPRREVRQRKPKKPFEQEDVPAKRNTKNSPHKNASNKKQINTTPIQNPSHKKGQGQKAAEAKLKEAREQEDTKHKATRQTRLTADEKDTENKHRDVIEDIEDLEHAESDSSSRRLSKRLQVKEKERLDQKNTDSVKIRRLSRQSARVNYKEDAVDSVDESTSARSARSSRQESISSADEVELNDTPVRMTTRSKNRIVDNKTSNKSGGKNDNLKPKPENSVEKKTLAITFSRLTPRAVIQGSNKDSKRDTRNTSKSSRQGSRSRSPVKIEATASFSQRRMITRQAVSDLDNSGPGIGTKIKRSLPPEFVEKLPQEQKRVKKPATSKNIQKSSKPSIGETGGLKENTLKENLKTELAETAKEISRPDTEAVRTKHKGTKKQRNKKKSRLNRPTPVPKEDLKSLKSENCEGDKSVIVNSERKEETKSQENKVISSLENGERDVKSMVTKSEAIKTHVKDKKPPKYTADETSKKATRSVINNDVREKEEDLVEISEVEKQVKTGSQELATEAELATGQKSIEQQSVIRSTSTFLTSVAQIKGSAQTLKLFVASDEVSSLPDDKSISHPTLTSERPKMAMYKLIPILDDNMSDLEESMVPISGFFVPGGNNDRILLPHNFMHGPVTAKLSSSTTASLSLPSWSSPMSASQISTLPTSVVSSSSGRSVYTLPPVASTTPSLTLELPSSVRVTTDCSPLRNALCTTVVSTLPSTVWTLPTQPSLVPSIAQTSTWTPQLPHSPQPLSVSEPLSVVVPKKSWTSTALEASPAQYRPSSSWNTTPSSSITPQPVIQQRQEQQQPWTTPSQQASQEASWSSAPSVTVAAVESWSKEFFPSTAFSNSANLRNGEPTVESPSQRMNSSAQNTLQHSGYSMVSGSSQQPQMYASNQDHATSSGTVYNAGPSQDSEFVDNRQDTVIQGFLRHVSSNPGGFSQELAGFNLVPQDFAYLENRLRQTLSPNTLFSAVTAYDDTSGHGTVVSHDNSLQESINLVHTVNLDMEEGNLDSSANLDLSDLGSTSASALNVSRNLDEPESSRGHQDVIHPQDNNAAVSARDLDSSELRDGADIVTRKPKSGSKKPKSDSKKPIRERKSQYEVINENDVRKFKCLICGKNFGVATIYRHLKIHDPDYKVRCSLCEKQYTQRNSLISHWRKTHGEHPISTGSMIKRKKLPCSEQEKLCPVRPPNIPLETSEVHLTSLNVSQKSLDGEGKLSESPVKSLSTQLKSPGTPINSPVEFKRQRSASSTSDVTTTSQNKSELSKQQAAHQQVEELRKFKAEKKLAAAQRKAESHALDDGVVNEDDLHRSTSKSGGCSGEESLYNITNSKTFTNDITEQSSATYEQGTSQKTSCPDSTSTAAALPSVSANSVHPQDDYESHVALKSQGTTQFQFNSPHPIVSIVPQFHADNIPKPISTPIVTSKLITEADSQKDRASSGESSHVKAGDKHVCEICNTQLNTRSGYTLHMQRHNKIKTKLCSYCDKGFHTSQELRSHERTHTGEKPFKCEICYTSFAHSGSFVSHKKSHVKRGENEAFPVIDGRIQYPPTFKKPRLSGGTDGNGEKPRRVRKTKLKMPPPESTDSEQLNQSQNIGSQQTSVIRRKHPENTLAESVDSAKRDFDKNITGRWENMNEQQPTPDSFRPSMGNPTLSNCNPTSGNPKILAIPQSVMSQDQANRGYTLSGDNYSSSSNVTLEYYNSPAGYSQSIQRQQEFMSPQLSTSSSPHEYYKQDKYYQRLSSVDTFPTGSRAVSVPVNLAVEKDQQYRGAQSYSDSGQGSASYSPHQHSSDYHYNVVPQSEEADYQQEDYEDSLVQYKNDPSSSEIVKKLLQHYNVPSSPFQEAVPLDYSHQIQETSEYNRIGHNAVSEYSSLGAGDSTPAPPPYSVSISSQHKHFYGSQPSTSDYDSSLAQQQLPSMTQDQPLPSPQHHQRQLLQSYLVKEEQFGSPQSRTQNVYNSEDRYIPTQSYQDTHFTSQALARPPSQSYSQSYEARTSLAHEYYSQSLPKIETLARDPFGNPSTETK